MIYNAFKDLKLSALGMGNMRLPVKDGNDVAIDEAATEAILDYCMTHGINYYDTAWGYHSGNSELVVISFANMFLTWISLQSSFSGR